MAGGLFGKPFAINIKCVIFSLICMALFLYQPNFSSNYALYGTLFVIFTIAYVAMAWYDYFFDCRILPLKRGDYSLTGKLKPEKHVSKEIECKRDNLVIYASHILFIVPLLVYIVYYNKKSNKMVFVLLGVLALFTLLYHSTKLIEYSHQSSSERA